MIKKTLKITILSIVCLTMLFSVPYFGGNSFTFAASKSVNDLRSDLSGLMNDKKNAEKSLDSVEKEVNKIQSEINEINGDIAKLKEEIKEIENELKAKQDEIENQENNLDARLVQMYKQGSVGFLDVMLGSNSISEFVSNIKLLRQIHQYDKEVIEALQKEYDAINEIKVGLDLKKAELNSQKNKLTDKKKELKKKQDEISSKIDSYSDEIEEITKEILKLIDPNSKYVGGDFLWPLPAKYRKTSRITGRWGWRIHPIKKVWSLHGGTDIGCPKGTPIYACASGTVIKSATYGNYGNTIMIDHGGGIVSLYAHCSKLCVSKGEFVVAGDKIAEVGATGGATGNHLHFEVRVNGSSVDSLQYFPDLYEILGPRN